MKKDLLFKNVILADGSVTDVGVRNGRFVDSYSLLRPDQVVDGKGLYLLPGLVDLHCHLREPGFTHKEDIASGTLAAAYGGYTTVCCMPNTEPVIDNEPMVRYLTERIRVCAKVRVLPIGALTRGQNGAALAAMGEMKAAGAVAFSDDGKDVADARLMLSAMKYAKGLGVPVFAHCEDAALAKGDAHEGSVTAVNGLVGIPGAAEDTATARNLILAAETGVRLHICHVSTARSVALIRHFKAQGVAVTAETCPHYVALTDEAVRNYDTDCKINPPLRAREDVNAVIAGLVDGTIDCIATDHAPHHPDEKKCEFALAPNGSVGFETAFAVCFTALVRTGKLTLAQLVNKMSAAPAALLGRKASVAVGEAADFFLFDDAAKWTVDRAALHGKSKNTAFHGQTVTGRVTATYVAGEKII